MIEVPAMLTKPVTEPDAAHVATNGDLLELLIDYQLSLRLCNGKLDAIGKAYGNGNGDK